MIFKKNYFIYFIASLAVISIMSCDDASIAFPGNYKEMKQEKPVNGSVDWYEGHRGEQGKGKVDENSQSGTLLGALRVEDENPDDEHTFTIETQAPNDPFAIEKVENEFILKLNSNYLNYEELISNNQSSDLTVAIRATDDSIEKLSGDFDVYITVENVNEAPFFTNTQVISTSANEGYPYGFDIDWNDIDSGDPVTFTVPVKPDWISWQDNGVITGTPNLSDVGTNNDVRLLVTDASGLYAQHDFSINVIGNQAPYFTGSRLTTALGNLLYEHQVTWQDPNPNDNLTFTVISHPAWLSWDANGNLSGTPTESDMGAVNTVVMTIMDQLGAFQTTDFTIDIPDILVDDFLIEDDSYLNVYAKVFDLSPSQSEDGTLDLANSETISAVSSGENSDTTDTTTVPGTVYTNQVEATYTFSSSDVVYTYSVDPNLSRQARGECTMVGKLFVSSLSGFHYSVDADLNNTGEDGQTQLQVYCKNVHTGVYEYNSNSNYNDATDQKVFVKSGDLTSPGRYEFYIKFGISDSNANTVQDIPDANFTLTLEKI